MRKDFITDERGQTLIDFVIGISLLFAIVGVVLFFIPQVTAPFSQSLNDASSVRSDQVADSLTEYELVDREGEPYVLDKECTVGFFSGDYSCVSGSDLDSAFQIPHSISENITIRETYGEIATIDGTRMAQGESVETSKVNTYRSTRIVSIDGVAYELHVVLW